MGKQIDGFTVKSHFEDKEPAVRHTYDRLLRATEKFGPVVEEPKKIDPSGQQDGVRGSRHAQERYRLDH